MLKSEIVDQLTNYIRGKYISGGLFNINGFLSVEKDIKEKFRLNKDVFFESFLIALEIAKNLTGIPVSCELKKNDSRSYKLFFTNLITGELEKTSQRLLGRNEIQREDEFNFWTIWLTNPNEDPFQQDKKVMVFTRPLEYENDNNENELKF